MDIRPNSNVRNAFPKIACGENIEIVKIRFLRPNMQLVAVVGEIRAADKLMSTWINCSNDYFECNFEITFLDGFVFSGRYEFWKESKTRPSFSVFVKKSLHAAQFLDCSTSEFLSAANESNCAGDQGCSSAPILSRYVIDAA